MSAYALFNYQRVHIKDKLTSQGKIAGVRYFEKSLLVLPCRIASCKKRMLGNLPFCKA